VTSDAQLMLDLRTGSREAFETLFERHRGDVWRFFRRRVIDGSRAEELTQDVFVAVLQSATLYEGRGSFRSYLFGIAYNILLADRRKSVGRTLQQVAETLPAAAIDLDAAMWVRHALSTLDPDARDIVMLREYEQLSYQDIAALLQIPVNTVRSRLFRARMDLKAALLGGVETPGARS
jgi:RNA polymerase sigma-70 factor, ECF subfamily